MHPGKSACGANRRSIQAALNKEDEPCAGKSGVKAASDSQRLHSCFKCLIVSISSHIQIYWGKQGECTFIPWEKTACTSWACVCVHTHMNTHRCMQEVALCVKQTDTPTPSMDLCLTGVPALDSFIFTTRIIFGSQHISKDLCWQLLSAWKYERLGCERLATLVNKWTGLDLNLKTKIIYFTENCSQKHF